MVWAGTASEPEAWLATILRRLLVNNTCCSNTYRLTSLCSSILVSNGVADMLSRGSHLVILDSLCHEQQLLQQSFKPRTTLKPLHQVHRLVAHAVPGLAVHVRDDIMATDDGSCEGGMFRMGRSTTLRKGRSVSKAKVCL